MCLKDPQQQKFPLLQAHMKGFAASLQSDQVSAVDVFRIYDMLPFRTNGAVVSDIGEIVDHCWTAALQNSKEMLLSKMTENPYFKQDVMKAINASTNDPARIVVQFHQQVLNEGFDAKKLLAVRNFYLSHKSDDQLKMK